MTIVAASTTWQEDPELLLRVLSATTTKDVEALLAVLPITPDTEYVWNESEPAAHWKAGQLHWVPVGRDRGNWGRIQLAGDPYNPAAERLVNGMEAIIELARQQELQLNPAAPMPSSPREAVLRYFQIPRLDQIPGMEKSKREAYEQRVDELRTRLWLRLRYDKKAKEFGLEIGDRGLGLVPARVHATLLSLGRTDKADKPYLIGAFGQGGSSAYAASTYSVVISRRSPELLGDAVDGIGWTVIKKITPKLRRDPYYAYLACLPEGHVPSIPLSVPGASDVKHGVVFRHLGYDFGKSGRVDTALYSALNHVLFNPVLPYDLYALRDKPDAMKGNAHRLARRAVMELKKGARAMDKSFAPQPVGASK